MAWGSWNYSQLNLVENTSGFAPVGFNNMRGARIQMRNIVNQGEIMNATRKLISNARSCRRQCAHPGSDGFTLTELLVVIATVGILGALILPALASTRPNSHAFQCLSNMKRLQLGSQLYANDNNDYFPGHVPLVDG